MVSLCVTHLTAFLMVSVRFLSITIFLQKFQSKSLSCDNIQTTLRKTFISVISTFLKSHFLFIVVFLRIALLFSGLLLFSSCFVLMMICLFSVLIYFNRLIYLRGSLPEDILDSVLFKFRELQGKPKVFNN